MIARSVVALGCCHYRIDVTMIMVRTAIEKPQLQL